MPQAQAANQMMSMFSLVLIVVIWVVLVILPQRKQDKERKKMLSAVVKNDEVVTTSGIHGTVVNVKDKTLIIRVDENVKIEFEKNCVAFVKKAQGANQGA